MSSTMEIAEKIYTVETAEIPEGADFAYSIIGPRKFELEFNGVFIDPENVSISISSGNVNGGGIYVDRIRFAPKTYADGSWRIDSYMTNIKRSAESGYFGPDLTNKAQSEVSKVIGDILLSIAPSFADKAAERAQRSVVASLEYKRDQALAEYDKAEKALMTARANLCELVGLS
jgi:hypothetical protein